METRNPIIPGDIGDGTIVLKLENLSWEETERIRDNLNHIVLQGAANLRNGKAVLHFDFNGILQRIELEHIKWNRKHDAAERSKIVGIDLLKNSPQPTQRAGVEQEKVYAKHR